MSTNPMTVTCPECASEAGSRCCTRSRLPARKPHERRVRLALAVAAHADPALDAFFARGSVPCGLCGIPGLPQRHRVVDAIAGRLAAGEDSQDVAADYLVSVDAVRAVEAWAARWPGAWQ